MHDTAEKIVAFSDSLFSVKIRTKRENIQVIKRTLNGKDRIN